MLAVSERSPIVRRPLRHDVREAILVRLVKGLHPAGSRIHEGQLAEELGVSRTPVREALMSLQQQGILEVRPNSGFYVVPVTPTDIREVYPMIGALEALAVRATPSVEFEGILAELLSLAKEMEQATDRPTREGELDNAWHALLISRCGNSRLINLVHELKTVVDRYESGFMTDGASVQASAKQHLGVVAALESSDIEPLISSRRTGIAACNASSRGTTGHTATADTGSGCRLRPRIPPSGQVDSGSSPRRLPGWSLEPS
jgi:DNA-binding GntR family transcriptional regulator